MAIKTHPRHRKGCVWLKQVTHTLRWLEAFLEGQSGTIIRSFSICNYSGRGPHLRLITDACPWGMGGVFTVDMWIVGWFATQITAYEVKLFGHAIGDPAGQQTWEALAIQVRQWIYKQTDTIGRSPPPSGRRADEEKGA